MIDIIEDVIEYFCSIRIGTTSFIKYWRRYHTYDDQIGNEDPGRSPTGSIQTRVQLQRFPASIWEEADSVYVRISTLLVELVENVEK